MSTKFILRKYDDFQKPIILSTEAVSASPIKTILQTSTKSLILLESGQVLEFGKDAIDLYTPLKGKVVSKMLVGESFLFITECGELYFLGHTNYDRFGKMPENYYGYDPIGMKLRNIREGSWTPQCPSERITCAACCYSSSLIITDDKNIYLLGQSFWFVPEDQASTTSSFRLPTDEDYRIVSASGGYFHASLLLSSGDVWVAGENDELFKLGVTLPGAQTFYNLAKCNNLNEKFVVAESAINHSVFATESRAIYLSGNPPVKPPGSMVTSSLYKLDFQPRTQIVCLRLVYQAGTMYVGTLDGLYSTNASHVTSKHGNNDDNTRAMPPAEIRYTSEHTSEYTGVSLFASANSFELFHVPLRPFTSINRHFIQPFRAFHDLDINFA